MVNNIQGDSGGKVNILEEIISDIVRKTVHVNFCPILNGYRDRTVWIFGPNYLRFVSVGLEKGGSLRRKVDKREEMHARILTAAARPLPALDFITW